MYFKGVFQEELMPESYSLLVLVLEMGLTILQAILIQLVVTSTVRSSLPSLRLFTFVCHLYVVTWHHLRSYKGKLALYLGSSDTKKISVSEEKYGTLPVLSIEIKVSNDSKISKEIVSAVLIVYSHGLGLNSLSYKGE